MIKGTDIAEEARRWVGVPFVHQGRSRHGVDCVGLVLAVRNAVEPLPEFATLDRTYRRQAVSNQLLEEIEAHCIALDEPEAGALVVIRWPRDKFAQHVGLLTPETIVHALVSERRVVEVGYREPWRRLSMGWWRLPGVTP